MKNRELVFETKLDTDGVCRQLLALAETYETCAAALRAGAERLARRNEPVPAVGHPEGTNQ